MFSHLAPVGSSLLERCKATVGVVEELPGPTGPTETLPGPTPLDRVFFLGAMGETTGLPPRRALAPEEREVDNSVEERGLVGPPLKLQRITSS